MTVALEQHAKHLRKVLANAKTAELTGRVTRNAAEEQETKARLRAMTFHLGRAVYHLERALGKVTPL